MKKAVSMLLVLTMVLALAGTAMAACKIEKGWVVFTKDANAYNAARESKKTNNVVREGSMARCDKVCGNFARLIVNENEQTKRWFKCSALKNVEEGFSYVVWSRGGKDMSASEGEIIKIKDIKGLRVKITGHTNLRKNPGMECKSQGVVEKCTLLKVTGYIGHDDRLHGYEEMYNWIQVCHKGRKLWVSTDFVKMSVKGNYRMVKLYDDKGVFVRYL
jgi:hypothetical protein